MLVLKPTYKSKLFSKCKSKAEGMKTGLEPTCHLRSHKIPLPWLRQQGEYEKICRLRGEVVLAE